MYRTKTQVLRDRQYRLQMYPLMESLRIGAISKQEFDERHLEVIRELDSVGREPRDGDER